MRPLPLPWGPAFFSLHLQWCSSQVHISPPFPTHYFCFQLWSSVLSPAEYFCGCQKLPFNPMLVLLMSHLVMVYQTEHQAGWIVLAWVAMKIRHGECGRHLNVRVAEHSERLNWVAFVLISSGCIDVVEVKEYKDWLLSLRLIDLLGLITPTS